MTKKQTLFIFIGGIVYSAFVQSLGGSSAYWLSYISLIFCLWLVLKTELDGYKK